MALILYNAKNTNHNVLKTRTFKKFMPPPWIEHGAFRSSVWRSPSWAKAAWNLCLQKCSKNRIYLLEVVFLPFSTRLELLSSILQFRFLSPFCLFLILSRYYPNSMLLNTKDRIDRRIGGHGLDCENLLVGASVVLWRTATPSAIESSVVSSPPVNVFWISTPSASFVWSEFILGQGEGEVRVKCG